MSWSILLFYSAITKPGAIAVRPWAALHSTAKRNASKLSGYKGGLFQM